MLYIKARYMKDGVQHGREYTFGSDVIVKPGEVVSMFRLEDVKAFWRII